VKNRLCFSNDHRFVMVLCHGVNQAEKKTIKENITNAFTDVFTKNPSLAFPKHHDGSQSAAPAATDAADAADASDFHDVSPELPSDPPAVPAHCIFPETPGAVQPPPVSKLTLHLKKEGETVTVEEYNTVVRLYPKLQGDLAQARQENHDLLRLMKAKEHQYEIGLKMKEAELSRLREENIRLTGHSPASLAPSSKDALFIGDARFSSPAVGISPPMAMTIPSIDVDHGTTVEDFYNDPLSFHDIEILTQSRHLTKSVQYAVDDAILWQKTVGGQNMDALKTGDLFQDLSSKECLIMFWKNSKEVFTGKMELLAATGLLIPKAYTATSTSTKSSC